MISANSSLSQRRILITGSAHGLGLGIARALAAGGAQVVLTDVDPVVRERCQEDGLRGRARAVTRDLAEVDAPQRIFETVLADGPLDGLVNCAAWSYHRPLAQVTTEDFDRLVAINQRAPYFLAQHFAAQAPPDADACVINISSVNALAGNANLTAYASTKGGLVAMSRALAIELAPRVRVVSLSPGCVLTTETQKLIAAGVIDPPRLLERFPIPRFITVDEIGTLVTFLFSPAAASITGANWVVDGGYTAQ